MAQLQNLVLTDRATPTPVNHTYVPSTIDPSTGAAYVKETTGVPIGEPNYSVRVTRPGGRYRINLRLVVPIVQTETINGINTPKIVRSAFVDAQFTFAGTSTEQERKDVVGLFQSSLDSGKTLVNDALVNLNPVY